MKSRLRMLKHEFDRVVYNTNIFTFLLWTSMVADVVYMILFLIVGQYFLAVVAAAKFAYAVSLFNYRDENGRSSLKQMLGLGVAVCIESVSGTLILGIDSGFHIIMLSMIPVCFFVEYLLLNSSMLSYFTSFVIFVANLMLIWIKDRFIHIGSLNVVQKELVQGVNWILAVFLVVFSATVFMAEVFNISNGLTNMNKKLNQLANYDPLTELLFRRPMLEEIDKCVEQKKLYGKDYVICIGDIDFFKKFNDQYGHQCGDIVLKTVSKIIVNGVDEQKDFVCRWGGEEILILLPDSKVYDARKIIEQIRKNIESTVITYGNENMKVTMTFGISSSETHIMSKEVIDSADKALYRGKNNGRNRVEV